jgi:hypothetical protein
MADGSPPFPDLTPPAGWGSFSLPPQIRLVPPGTTKDTARATIIVSPIAPRHPAMPPPAELVAQAIDAEARLRLDILERSAPAVAPSDHGLAGTAVVVRGRERDGGAEQGRIYVVYADDRFLYGVSYMAFGRQVYDEHVATFWRVARSIRPFHGRVVPPAPPPTAVD